MRGSLSLGLGAPGPGCLLLGCCLHDPPSLPCRSWQEAALPGGAPGEGQMDLAGAPLGCEFSLLAEGLGRARTPWGDEGPRGLFCGAGISRATQRMTALPTVQPPPPGMKRAAAQRWGDHTPAPPAVGQLPGQLPAPEPRQAALSLSAPGWSPFRTLGLWVGLGSHSHSRLVLNSGVSGGAGSHAVRGRTGQPHHLQAGAFKSEQLARSCHSRPSPMEGATRAPGRGLEWMGGRGQWGCARWARERESVSRGGGLHPMCCLTPR